MCQLQACLHLRFLCKRGTMHQALPLMQVKALNLEEGGAFTVSSADNILAGL